MRHPVQKVVFFFLKLSLAWDTLYNCGYKVETVCV